MNKQLYTFRVGLIYIGNTHPFEIMSIQAYNVTEALNLGANYMRPNHLQTLTIVGQPIVDQ